MALARRTAGTSVPPRRKTGQSLIESCLAIALICLVFMGLYQIARLFAGREVLQHAAARAARAKTVGFNWWMVRKSVLVAAIPNAGRMTEPPFENIDTFLRAAVSNMPPGQLWDVLLHDVTPPSLQYVIERSRIPDFMASDDEWQGRNILNYADWDTIRGPAFMPSDPSVTNVLIEMRVGQEYPLWVPMHRLYYAADSVNLDGNSTLENHYPLYLDDHNW